MTDYADLKAKAEATLRAGERTAAEPPCGCEDCGWASVVLALLAENERLQRERDEARRELGTHRLNDVGQCPMCYDAGYGAAEAQLASAVSRIAELSAENGRLFRERNAAEQRVAALEELRDWTPGRRTKSRVPAIAEDPVREETNG